MMETNEVTKKHRKKQNLSYRGFADAVNSKLVNTDMSYSTVRRLETENYEPNLNLLFECIVTYPDTWIAEWAVENISAMYPDLIESGVIEFHLPKSGRG